MKLFLASLRRLRRLWPSAGGLSLQERYSQFEIGVGSYAADDLRVRRFGMDAALRVGAYTSIASGVEILLGGEHRSDWVTTYPFSALWPSAKHILGHPRSKGHVDIGSDVWLATGATILSGVTVGDGAVVGARAVISKDVPPYAVVAGNPATVVRYRFNAATIERLLIIRWWEWPQSRVSRALPYLLSKDINRFLDAVDSGEL